MQDNFPSIEIVFMEEETEKIPDFSTMQVINIIIEFSIFHPFIIF